MKVKVKEMKKLSEEYVDYLLDYRKETATLVLRLLESTPETEVDVAFLQDRLDSLGLDPHRLADAKKMVRVMGNELNVTEATKEYLRKLHTRKRKPLSECIVNPNKDN